MADSQGNATGSVPIQVNVTLQSMSGESAPQPVVYAFTSNGRFLSKASVSKADSESGENGKSKVAGQAAKAAGKSGEAGTKAGREKAASSKKSSGAKESRADSKTKSVAGAISEGNGGFANPTVASAYKQALKKYPNAFRKLTD